MKNLKLKTNSINKPWGYYLVLETTKSFQIKEIVIYPNKRLSLQKHKKRDEYWTVLNGKAEVILNDKKLNLLKGESIFIPRNNIHRVKNTGFDDLIIKELQTGDYFGEDDIIRIDDDYGRKWI